MFCVITFSTQTVLCVVIVSSFSLSDGDGTGNPNLRYTNALLHLKRWCFGFRLCCRVQEFLGSGTLVASESFSIATKIMDDGEMVAKIACLMGGRLSREVPAVAVAARNISPFALTTLPGRVSP